MSIETSKSTTPKDKQSIAALSYLEGGVLEEQGTWDAPYESGMNGRWDREWTLSAYLGLTDRMISLMGGYEHDDDQPEKVPDKVIFLDKSARPVAWLIDALWEQMADKGRKKPEFDFMNIDRKTWWALLGRPLTGEENRDVSEFTIDKVPQDLINRLRARFVDGKLSLDGYAKEVWRLPTTLDGKKVMIVDEVRSSGATLYMARALLSRAIPEAEFYGEYFWKAPYSEGTGVEIHDKQQGTRSTQWQMFNVPVWYDKNSPDGRGILDPIEDIRKEIYLSDRTQRNLKDFLSWFVHGTTREEARYPVDERARRLMADFAIMSYLNDLWRFFMPMSETWHRRQVAALAAELGIDPASSAARDAARGHNQQIRSHQKKRTI